MGTSFFLPSLRGRVFFFGCRCGEPGCYSLTGFLGPRNENKINIKQRQQKEKTNMGSLHSRMPIKPMTWKNQLARTLILIRIVCPDEVGSTFKQRKQLHEQSGRKHPQSAFQEVACRAHTRAREELLRTFGRTDLRHSPLPLPRTRNTHMSSRRLQDCSMSTLSL